jgi:hypothetical protein
VLTVMMMPLVAGVQTLNGMQGGLGGSASPSFEDGNYRVGKYSMEERKIRIHRYQQKRTQRNFNKKIKVHLLSFLPSVVAIIPIRVVWWAYKKIQFCSCALSLEYTK